MKSPRKLVVGGFSDQRQAQQHAHNLNIGLPGAPQRYVAMRASGRWAVFDTQPKDEPRKHDSTWGAIGNYTDGRWW